MNDPCVKYVRDWNRAEKAIACRHLSKANQAMNERARDRTEDLLFTARPESLLALVASCNRARSSLLVPSHSR